MKFFEKKLYNEKKIFIFVNVYVLSKSICKCICFD